MMSLHKWSWEHPTLHVYVIHIMTEKLLSSSVVLLLYTFLGVQSYGDTYDATAITGACEGIGGGSVRSLNW